MTVLIRNETASADVSPELLARSREYCRDLTRRAARNFYHGLKLLPEPKRSAMYALYAYMRLVDDIADDDQQTATLPQRIENLAHWQSLTHQAIEAARSNGPLPDDRLLWPAFILMVRDYAIPPHVFDDMIAGQRQDLEPVSISDFEALRQYCYRVASVVGVASLYVFGFEGGEKTLALGVDRGIAFQLTNILRDLREDAARGRCYLPADELARFGVSAGDIAAGKKSAAFNDLLQFQIRRVQSFYDASAPLESCVAADARPTLSAMTMIYHGLLEKIARRPEAVLEGRVRLSGISKLVIAWRAMRGGR